MFTFKGVSDVIKSLKQISEGTVKKVEKAIYAEYEAVMGRAKSEFVPVDLGTLASSGFVNPPERKGEYINVTMGFGGPSDAYAIAIHEHPSGHSPPSWEGVEVNFSPAGRGPKYLERPLLEAEKGMIDRIAAKIEIK